MPTPLVAPASASGRSWAVLLRAGGRTRYVLAVLLLAGLYYGAARLGHVLEFAGPVAAIVWLPVGIGIAFLYLGRIAFWPGVLLGEALANSYFMLPFGSAVGQTLGNVLEIVVAALLLKRLVRRGTPLDSVQGVCGMLVAIAAGTLVSATIGPLSLLAGSVISRDEIFDVWRTWWLGDACGSLIVVPLAIAWYRRGSAAWLRGRALEAALLLATIVGLSELSLRSHRPLAYLVFPALIWAALRFGARGATFAVTVAALLAVWNTVHYVGPFAFHSITRSVLTTQLYIAVSAISTYCLAAVVSERERFALALVASRARLVGAADVERRRLERNLHDGAQQSLTALFFQLGIARERAAASPDEATSLIEDAQERVAVAIEELRELAHGIHPSVVIDLGLAEAIRTLARQSPLRIEVLDLPRARFDSTAEATAYYVVAEAITNAQKHAHASVVRIRVVGTNGVLRIDVVDDGIGGAVETAGSGLEGLRDRVEAIRGRFSVDSSPEHGTLVAATIPALVASVADA